METIENIFSWCASLISKRRLRKHYREQMERIRHDHQVYMDWTREHVKKTGCLKAGQWTRRQRQIDQVEHLRRCDTYLRELKFYSDKLKELTHSNKGV